MRKLKLILGGIWGLAAVALIILTIIDFCLFYLLMTIGCAGMAVLLFLEYFWTRFDEYDPDGFSEYKGGW